MPESMKEGDEVPAVVPMSDRERLAKTYFDCHEYDRCAYLLREGTTPMSLFLRLYALYIVSSPSPLQTKIKLTNGWQSGEKKKEEEHGGVLSPKDGIAPNRQITVIIRELDEYFQTNEEEPFLLYLYGVALIHQKNTSEALVHLLKSVSLFPYNWSAWQELLECIDSLEKFHEIEDSLPRHLMGRIFTIYAQQEFYQHEQANLEEIDDISTFLPRFNFLTIQKALVYYHGLNYIESELAFEEVLALDPHRLDDMDTYSNILYVMERRPKLAYLAQLASSTDKFRPETCCIIANYYSLKSEHEKSISYYQRALTLNRNCLSAWTLMGHEFVELKNTHAAIESYRHAIDVNKKDFRAWYGLGQAYEVLDMNYYSLYYYQRAAALKPFDARMWQALGHCYNQLGKIDESLKSYKRCLKLSDVDPVILLRIAFIYEKLGDFAQCAVYMGFCVDEEEAEGVSDETSQARLWLAKYELAQGRYEQASAYAKGFTRGSAAELEEARAIVRETRTRMVAE